MRGQQVEQSSRFSHSIGSVSHSQHAGGEVGEGIILQSGLIGLGTSRLETSLGGRLEQAREFIIGLEPLELLEKQSRAGSRLKSSSFYLQD